MTHELKIRAYQQAMNSAAARGDMNRAAAFGGRLSQLIQTMDSSGLLDDGRMTAFNIGRGF